MASRSRNSHRGAVSSGKASIICCAVHAAVGWSVIAKVDNSSALMREQHEDEQHAPGQGREREEVHRHQRRHVISQEGSPCL